MSGFPGALCLTSISTHWPPLGSAAWVSQLHPQKGTDRSWWRLCSWLPSTCRPRVHSGQSRAECVCDTYSPKTVRDLSWANTSLPYNFVVCLFLLESAANTTSCLWALVVKPGGLSPCPAPTGSPCAGEASPEKSGTRGWEEDEKIQCN